MAKYTCSCGARYKFPDSALGKRAKCKKCGAVFTLEVEDEGIFALADEPDFPQPSHLENPVDPEAAINQPQQGEVFTSSGHPVSRGLSASDALQSDGEQTSAKSFTSDVLWTFLFPSTPTNLISFLVIWFAMVIAPLAGCVPLIGLLLTIIVIGWYCAFRFMVLASAAAGEDNIPDVNISSDSRADYIVYFLKWTGSWIIVMAPAFIYLMLTLSQSSATVDSAVDMMAGGIGGILQGSGSGTGIFEVLVYLGIFIWPMIILCIALGGFSAIYRLDLIFITIAKTFHVYAITVILVFGAIFIQVALEEIIAGKITTNTPNTITGVLASAIPLRILITGVSVYFEIVVMRLIGLYYFHFKHKFAWSWE